MLNEEMKQELLKKIELELEKQNEEHMDEVVAMICEEVKKLIPGEQYDGLVELMKPAMEKILKAQAAKLIEKISPLV